jgi:hypothetical protein
MAKFLVELKPVKARRQRQNPRAIRSIAAAVYTCLADLTARDMKLPVNAQVGCLC